MAGLGDTVASLARYRQLAAGVPGVALGAQDLQPLCETIGWGANPGALRMLSYAPKSTGGGAALVVVLHGCTQTAKAYAEGAGWLSLADQHGFVVLCPEQQAANNQNRCFNWFEPQDTVHGGGEAESIAQMIRRAVSDHDIDRGRIFVTGLSAGGAMTSVMLATYPELFTGGAIVAGLPFGAANSVQEAFAAMFQGRIRPASAWGALVRAAAPASSRRQPRISIWHGDADATVKPINAEEIAKQWVDVVGLEMGEARVSADGRRRRRTWEKQGEVIVELNMIKGLAHGTPLDTRGEDRCGHAGPFLLEAGVSSSAEIARFWGIAPERNAKAAAPLAAEPVAAAASSPLKPKSKPEPGSSMPQSAKPFKSVEQAITKALANAGLIKAGSQNKDRSSI